MLCLLVVLGVGKASRKGEGVNRGGGWAERADLHLVMVAPMQFFIFQSAKIGMQHNPSITRTTQASWMHWGDCWGKGHAGKGGYYGD